MRLISSGRPVSAAQLPISVTLALDLLDLACVCAFDLVLVSSLACVGWTVSAGGACAAKELVGPVMVEVWLRVSECVAEMMSAGLFSCRLEVLDERAVARPISRSLLSTSSGLAALNDLCDCRDSFRGLLFVGIEDRRTGMIGG